MSWCVQTLYPARLPAGFNLQLVKSNGRNVLFLPALQSHLQRIAAVNGGRNTSTTYTTAASTILYIYKRSQWSHSGSTCWEEKESSDGQAAGQVGSFFYWTSYIIYPLLSSPFLLLLASLFECVAIRGCLTEWSSCSSRWWCLNREREREILVSWGFSQQSAQTSTTTTQTASK